MIKDEDIIYWVWLSQVLGAGNTDVEYILSKFNSPKDLYNFGRKRGFDNLKFFSNYIKNKMKSVTIDAAKIIVEQCRNFGYEIVTFKDKKYPYRLKNIYASPLILYMNGDIGDIDNILAISIIGARKCSDYAKQVAKLFSRQLSLNGVTIISGMAVGVDGISLEEALNYNGKVIAVVGCGLDVDYPFKNLGLKKRIEDSQNGCIISEYPPGTKPLAGHFPVRNRIMSGLSVGVLVVEAGVKSGSLITAKIAIDQGKDVYGVPNNIFFEKNYGAMNLLKEGAIIVTNPEDIINQYKWQYNFNRINSIESTNDTDIKNIINNIDDNTNSVVDINVQEDYNLDGILKEIYSLLCNCGPRNVDYISEKLNLPVNEVLINITELELNGFIKNYPGMKYGINFS